MAAAGVCLAVYAAVVRQNMMLSSLGLLLGLLSKENAVIAPGLIVWAWIVGCRGPSSDGCSSSPASWVVIAGAYLALRGNRARPVRAPARHRARLPGRNRVRRTADSSGCAHRTSAPLVCR